MLEADSALNIPLTLTVKRTRITLVASIAVLIALAVWTWRAPTPVLPVGAVGVSVHFFNCARSYPCEVVTNDSSEPVSLTVSNSHRTEQVQLAAHSSITIELDATDN